MIGQKGQSRPLRQSPLPLFNPDRRVRMPAFRVPPSLGRPKRVFLICHYCGYGPEVVPAAGRCPKCGGQSWERFALPEPLVPAHMK